MEEILFSYGTLQLESVQLNTFGRKLEGDPDVLTGYKITLVKIEDEAVVAASGMTHYNNLTYTGNASDEINGMVLKLTETELQQADEYEADADYKRIRVELQSGKTAWVFLCTNNQDQ
ncbi:MAG: gamma-glutamylcyclotransferase family protein [Ginsengibacter sp.]